MNPAVHIRKLLQVSGDNTLQDSLSPTTTTKTYSPDPLLQPINGSSSFTRKPFNPNNTVPFDSSMALTILVLFTALFFLGFLSIYIRRFTNEDNGSTTELRRRRQPSSLRSHYPKGFDPSTLNSLPVIPYDEDANHPIEDCRICLGEFEEREIVKLIPYCGHVFHPQCIETWLSSHRSCPLCRSTKLFINGDEEKCLGVIRGRVDHDDSDLNESLTVDEADTWTEVGTGGLRRTCSCTSLVDRVVLQRSSSF